MSASPRSSTTAINSLLLGGIIAHAAAFALLGGIIAHAAAFALPEFARKVIEAAKANLDTPEKSASAQSSDRSRQKNPAHWS
ncbi:hypothetical protein PtA15_17A169 [Puccinia triticina]|uniref:Uncharacterized protein n=1 Tax=Puccinia triticina TaxID=208348 RepID=A0ABY7D8T6_9BASI|nr:uncharacterized protein PtA15_17A169 [Puccinia triticina]WAQ92687.1 hypothetical protein PtA15_17A169 [Puccinia triticina]